MKFLKTRETEIIDSSGRSVFLRGINLGGWLLMEGYILHAPNVAEQVFKKEFKKALGQMSLDDFEKKFRNTFIQKSDIKTIAQYGFNCIRVPFHYHLIEKSPYCYKREGIKFLDNVLCWAGEFGLYVILDLHAAVGSQNCDWHSDSLGRAALWESPSKQKRTLALWAFLADRYKDHASLAGYDVLNEAVIDNKKQLNSFYRDAIASIRSVDRKHIIFIEGNLWATDLSCLDRFDDDNISLSIHVYQPLDFTFNFVPHLTYPLHSKKGTFGRMTLDKMMSGYASFARKYHAPVFVGEFGVNYRQGLYGEDRWLSDVLKVFKKYGFHWTYWTYKAVKNSVFPDGIISYMANPPWVNRIGPLYGWQMYSRCWPKQKKEMISSWKTKSFYENRIILDVLKKAARA